LAGAAAATPHTEFVAEDLYQTFFGEPAGVIGARIDKYVPSQ
jgi:hypothetical protein